MQKYKVSFKGQNIYVGIDVHLKTNTKGTPLCTSIHRPFSGLFIAAD